jgi:hypothetical protein
MNLWLITVVAFGLLVPANGLLHSKRLGNASLSHVLASVSRVVDERTDIRPNAGGDADVIEYGFLTKAFYGIDLKAGTFSVDLVTTLRWKDPRAVALIPKKHHELTLPIGKAKTQMWLPDIQLTSRDRGGVEVLSSAVSINETGVVTKVERSVAILKNAFNIVAFPFDYQNLKLRIASSSLMMDDLRLKPISDKSVTGVKNGVFDGKSFSLVSVETRAVEEVDGPLRKSRGELVMVVKRVAGPYISSLLIPEMLIVGISSGVYWLPLHGPFVMPRVATALIAFLSLMTLSLRTNALLPMPTGVTWIDLFQSDCQSLMFLTVCFNIFVLSVYHNFERKLLAFQFDHEMKALFPGTAGILFGICFYNTDGTELNWMVFLTNCGLCLGGLLYVGYCILRLRNVVPATPRGTPRSMVAPEVRQNEIKDAPAAPSQSAAEGGVNNY